jgi:hypothetical protein
LPALDDARGGFNMQTKSTQFSCDNFNKLRDQQVVKGVYTCRSGQKDPGRLGTNVGSDGNSTKKGAAPSTFSPATSSYSFLGLVAFLFML